MLGQDIKSRSNHKGSSIRQQVKNYRSDYIPTPHPPPQVQMQFIMEKGSQEYDLSGLVPFDVVAALTPSQKSLVIACLHLWGASDLNKEELEKKRDNGFQ